MDIRYLEKVKLYFEDSPPCVEILVANFFVGSGVNSIYLWQGRQEKPRCGLRSAGPAGESEEKKS